MAHDAARAEAKSQVAHDDHSTLPRWTFESLLRELVDERKYPRLHRIAWAEEIGNNPSGFDERQEFHFGLDRILDGVQALVVQAQTDLGPAQFQL
jgi:hypothetical protein